MTDVIQTYMTFITIDVSPVKRKGVVLALNEEIVKFKSPASGDYEILTFDHDERHKPRKNIVLPETATFTSQT